MDLLDILKKDHDEVRDLFKQFDGLKDDPKKNSARLQSIYKSVKRELAPHMAGEEKIFYPRLRKQEHTRPDALEAVEEHQVAKTLMRQLDRNGMSERWVAKMTVLKEVVEHHAEEEENGVFKESRRLFSGDELSEMGQEFQKTKSRAR